MASKSGVLAGKAFVLLEAIDGTAATLRSVEGNLMSWGTRLQSIGARIFARGLTAMVPSALSVNIFKQFDDIMRRVEARTSGSASEMQALRDQARGLGKDSAFSAREVAGLQDVLAQRKFNRTQIAEMTPSIAMLGRAAGSGDNPAQDLLNASDLVSQAIMMYELGANDAARVSDIFTAAANESNFALEDLIISMANAGPVAHQYGMSLEETLATMMVMRDLSIDPSVAGTGLRNLFLKASDGKAVEDFNKLMFEATGQIIDFEDAAGNLQKPSDILFNFDKLTKGMGTASRGHLLAELFGLRAITPATAVAASATNFSDALAAVTNSAGATEAAYKKMEGGIGGTFRRLANTAEAMALNLGEALAPAVDMIGKFLIGLNLGIADWIAANQQLVVTINLVVAVLVPLGAALFITGVAFKILASIITPFRLMLGLLTSSVRFLSMLLVGALTKALMTVSMAFRLFFTTITVGIAVVKSVVTIGSLVVSVFSAIASGIIAAVSFIIPGLLALGLAIVQAFGWLIATAPVLTLVLLSIAPILLMLAAGVFSVNEETQQLAENAEAVGTSFSIWDSMISSVIGTWGEMVSIMSNSINFIINRFWEMGQSVFKTLGYITQALMSGDMALAWQIGVTGMKLVWAQFTDFIWDTWFNTISRIKADLIKFQLWVLEMDLKHNPMNDSWDIINNGLMQAKLQRQLKDAQSGKDNSPDNWSRENDIEFYKQQLDLLGRMAGRRKSVLDSLQMEGMNTPLGLGAQDDAFKDLIKDGAGGITGGKAVDALQKGSVEAAKAAYENDQNRREAIANKELEKLTNIDKGINQVNGHLADLKSNQVEVKGV